jgi:hypothetical protein
MKQTFHLQHDTARRRAMAAVVDAPAGHVVTVSEPNRNLSQNAAQWPILAAFSAQQLWPVNGRMVRMEPAEWKDVLSAAFRGEQARLAMGLAGGVVMLGQRTREFSKREFSDWLEFLYATAAARGVELDDAATLGG